MRCASHTDAHRPPRLTKLTIRVTSGAAEKLLNPMILLDKQLWHAACSYPVVYRSLIFLGLTLSAAIKLPPLAALFFARDARASLEEPA